MTENVRGNLFLLIGRITDPLLNVATTHALQAASYALGGDS
jgi:hypothetical protein